MGPSAGIGLLFNGSVTTTPVVTPIFDCLQAQTSTIQTRAVAQNVTVEIQGTLVPDRTANSTLIGPTNPPRDDSVTSADWVVLATNTATAGSSRIDQPVYSTFRALRVRLTAATGTATVTVWARNSGVE